MRSDDYLTEEHRRYIRLDTVFPVQFRAESLDGSHSLSVWLQGFTSNVSSGGICLCVNNLDSALAKMIESHQVKLSLNIEIPVFKNPIGAKASAAWIKCVAGASNKYLVGLYYEEINPNQNKKLMRYARAKKIFIPMGLGIVILLGLGLIANSLINMRLAQGNRALVLQLVNITRDSGILKQKMLSIIREKEDLQIKIERLELRIATVEAEKLRLRDKSKTEIGEYSQKLEELNGLIRGFSQEKVALKEQLVSAQHQESLFTDEFKRLDKKKITLEKANLDNMYQWLKVHQNQHTGLVMSFEGDDSVKDWAFIYDQSLVAQAYTYSLDFKRLHALLDFFNDHAKRKGGLFFNAYYAGDGEPAEYVVHSGPNIWIGIAIAQYTYKAQDRRYLRLAEEIAEAIIDLQNQDPQGGIRGGPDVSWYATEHNLDAYAFFNMLYKITGKAKYVDSANKVLNWLTEHTYDKTDIPIKRGKGDSTIATDTYTWSIAAIGPQRLEKLGMDPDKIMEFAEANCSVEVSYQRPEGETIKVKGFDFAPERNLGRGGVVSSEWTAQMVIAFQIMEEFYSKKGMVAKAKEYKDKAEEYLSSLGKMIISSPSPSGQGESCFPYATQDFVDTGHGWFTPKGKSTGSISGTAYIFFAYYNYNPLELKD